MNIIRTAAIELTAIPAIAYKMKLAAGGAGVKIFRLDKDVQAVMTIDRRTGDAIPYKPYDESLFPEEAVLEALEATKGLPYSARGKIKITISEQAAEAEDVTEDETQKVDMVLSDEYQAIINRYADEKGKLNYQLMNKDFIQFASKSKIVSDLVGKRAAPDEILLHVIKNRAAYIADKKESLSDAETAALIETLDEIDPRSAFKELTAHIRRLLSKTGAR
jgi:hypothetical protein